MCDSQRYKYAEIDPSWTKRDRFRAIQHVIEVEQPIHIYELSSRVIQFYDGWKVTARVIKAVENDLQCIMSEFGIVKKGDFYQIGDFVDMKVRWSIRKIQHVSDEEIAKAMRSVLEKLGSPRRIDEKQEMFRLVAWNLGYFRLGSQIRNAFNRVYEKMEK